MSFRDTTDTIPIDLPAELYERLDAYASVLGVPIDRVLEAALEPLPMVCARKLPSEPSRTFIGTIMPVAATAVCRHRTGGPCPRVFRWRGVVRCGCAPKSN